MPCAGPLSWQWSQNYDPDLITRKCLLLLLLQARSEVRAKHVVNLAGELLSNSLFLGKGVAFGNYSTGTEPVWGWGAGIREDELERSCTEPSFVFLWGRVIPS